MNKIADNISSSVASSVARVLSGSGGGGGGGGGGSTTWSAQIVASGDDGWWDQAMNFENSGTTTKVGFSGMMYVNENSWFRFQNVTVPQGSTISTATLTLIGASNATATFDMILRGEDTDDSTAYSSRTDAHSASNTTANVTWSGSSSWATGDSHDSPEIKTVIQEITDRTGWASGNDLTLRLLYGGSGLGGEYYLFKTFDDSAGVSASLSITYTS